MGICQYCKLLLERKKEAVTNVYSHEPLGNGVALTPPMGWSSWNRFRQRIDSDNLEQMAAAMQKSGLVDAGYIYFNLDDCWQSSLRDENDELQGDMTRFPADMGIFIKRINEYGMKVGLYTSNGTLTCEDLPASLGREYKDAYTFARWGAEYFKYDFCHNVPYSSLAPLICGIVISQPSEKPFFSISIAETRLIGGAKLMRDEALPRGGNFVIGINANQGAVEFDVTAPKSGTYAVSLECKKASDNMRHIFAQVNGGSQFFECEAYCKNLSNVYYRAQFLIDLDEGLNTVKLFNPIANLADSSMLLYAKMSRALRTATKRVAAERGEAEKPIVFSICEWGLSKPWEWAASVGNLWRTTGDIRPIWLRINMIYNKTVDLYKYNVKGGYNDPDMLEVGNGKLTDDENKTHFSLWCMMGAPLILGNDIRDFIKEDGTVDTNNRTLQIISDKDLIAIDQDELCRAGKRVKKGNVDVLAKPLSDGVAVCLYNKTKHSVNATFDLTSLTTDEYINFPSAEQYEYFDLWSKETGTTGAKISVQLPSHGCAVYKFKR